MRFPHRTGCGIDLPSLDGVGIDPLPTALKAVQKGDRFTEGVETGENGLTVG